MINNIGFTLDTDANEITISMPYDEYKDFCSELLGVPQIHFRDTFDTIERFTDFFVENIHEDYYEDDIEDMDIEV